MTCWLFGEVRQMIFISLAQTELFCIMTVINHTKGDFFIHMMHLSTGAWGFIWVLIVQLVLAIGIAWIKAAS
ncbi:MAG: hypothetical protein GX226_03400 [Dehalococcoidales bacterium]|nr:hypothetical protein [Dehalococcoidales bacterium]